MSVDPFRDVRVELQIVADAWDRIRALAEECGFTPNGERYQCTRCQRYTHPINWTEHVAQHLARDHRRAEGRRAGHLPGRFADVPNRHYGR